MLLVHCPSCSISALMPNSARDVLTFDHITCAGVCIDLVHHILYTEQPASCEFKPSMQYDIYYSFVVCRELL